MKIKDLILYTTLALGITPFASSLFGYNLKMPFLFLGIILLFVWNKPFVNILQKSLITKKQQLTFIFLGFMVSLGLFTGGNISAVFTDLFAIAFFFLFYNLSAKNEQEYNTLKNTVLKLFIAISIIEPVIMFAGISSAATESARTISLVVCPFFLSMYYLKEKKMIVSIIFVLIMVLMTIRGGMRVNYLFAILYILYLLHSIFIRRSLALWKKAFVVVALGVLFTIIFPIAKEYIESDGSRSLHMINRFENLFEKDSAEEEVRKQTNAIILHQTSDFIFPQGIGWQNHTGKIQRKYRAEYGILSTMDSNLLYCVYHFGLIFGLYIIYLIGFRCLKNMLVNFRHFSSTPNILASFLYLAVLFLFILKSWIFVYASFGITYGLMITMANGISRFEKNKV